MSIFRRLSILLLCGVFALGTSTATAWQCADGDDSAESTADPDPLGQSDPGEQALPARRDTSSRHLAPAAPRSRLFEREPAHRAASFFPPRAWLSVGNGMDGPLRC